MKESKKPPQSGYSKEETVKQLELLQEGLRKVQTQALMAWMQAELWFGDVTEIGYESSNWLT